MSSEENNEMCEESESDENILMKKQRKEKKDLINKFTVLKHGLNKNDKKGKKELLTRQSAEEATMDERHKKELAQLKYDEKESQQDAAKNGSSDGGGDKAAVIEKVSKAQKRRELKEQRDRECYERVFEMEAQSCNNERRKERERLERVLSANNLTMVEIPADGDCLYNAVSHQLSLFGERIDAQALRTESAKILRLNKSAFVPFYDNEEVTYADYCDKVEQTKLWGGNLELKALSTFLERTINVLQSDGTIISIKSENVEPLNDCLSIMYVSSSIGGLHLC